LHEEVTLADELGHMRNYVEMLNYRYPGRFQLVAEVDDELYSYPLIKLVLQPIVENAIYHGLDDRKPLMRITIASVRTPKAWLLQVKDDGIGMDGATLDRLNRNLGGMAGHAGKRELGGIGLANVNERIRLHYGNSYGLKVSSVQGAGTEVSLYLPIKPKDVAQ
jgi:two-component system sensor histidine kinase YesM